MTLRNKKKDTADITFQSMCDKEAKRGGSQKTSKSAIPAKTMRPSLTTPRPKVMDRLRSRLQKVQTNKPRSLRVSHLSSFNPIADL